MREDQPTPSPRSISWIRSLTGATIAVPLFISTGEKIKVDTRTGQYLGRA